MQQSTNTLRLLYADYRRPACERRRKRGAARYKPAHRGGGNPCADGAQRVGKDHPAHDHHGLFKLYDHPGEDPL